MNNPYEDLFKTAAKPDPTQPGLAPAVPPADDDMLDDRHKTRKTNLRLLVVYILGLVIVNVAIYAIYFLTYGDPVATQANIVEVDVQFIPSESSLYPDDPFAVILDGRFENHNTFRLGKIVADFTFLDGEGNTVGTSSYSLDHVEPTAALIVHDVLYFDTAVASIEYEWGFDMSSTFYLAVNAIHTISIALIFILLDRAHFADRWRRTKKGWKQALGGIVTGEIMVYMALLFSSILMERPGITTGSENEATIASLFKPDPVILGTLFLTLCVFTPIVEETIFRKVLFGFFPKKLGPTLPILLSGLIFGLMHVATAGDLPQAIPYVMMGFVFGYVYWSSGRNIYVTMGVHFLNNFISFLIYVAALYGFIF
ncbi:MAG: hypothetical protein A2Y16_00355 [Tenericutes bacterium GWF2_57_13]|nr:MAG: hypothetical protein A2Y16_00355 [Tenericutes bacterium GWF2_57_13]